MGSIPQNIRISVYKYVRQASAFKQFQGLQFVLQIWLDNQFGKKVVGPLKKLDGVGTVDNRRSID